MTMKQVLATAAALTATVNSPHKLPQNEQNSPAKPIVASVNTSELRAPSIIALADSWVEKQFPGQNLKANFVTRELSPNVMEVFENAALRAGIISEQEPQQQSKFSKLANTVPVTITSNGDFKEVTPGDFQVIINTNTGKATLSGDLGDIPVAVQLATYSVDKTGNSFRVEFLAANEHEGSYKIQKSNNLSTWTGGTDLTTPPAGWVRGTPVAGNATWKGTKIAADGVTYNYDWEVNVPTTKETFTTTITPSTTRDFIRGRNEVAAGVFIALVENRPAFVPNP